jgi:two-component system cell cycle response regulator
MAPYGRAYRLGGDEFCALVRPGRTGREPLLAAAAAALSERGRGFAVDASLGAVLIPTEADTMEQALQTADRRMYAQKGEGRATASRQTRDVLLRTLEERQPDLHAHLRDVAALAVVVGRGLGMSSEELDETARAAELHDVGKVAIPDAILSKPGPLDDDERDFMRRHTIIGERILAAAPALVPVSRLVRSSHERFDGGGYPDGLAGEQIPLGARVVAVCDAYDAMTSERPYRRPLSQEEAIAELRSSSGTQFDPAVVDAFCDAVEAWPAAEEPDGAGAIRG